jgi:REP element-mobilizing transposase RayT
VTRPLRIEYAGALYHITARGNAKQNIYFDEQDRHQFLDILSTAIARNYWLCHAYCLMSNHYHLLIETNEPTLSRGMRYLNGVYSQYINRRYHRVGHLFQGRFKAIFVEKDSYLLELSRYIVLNPVRAKMVSIAKDWPWSSYRATTGHVMKPGWLTTDCLLSGFAMQRTKAVEAYKRFVSEGEGQASPWQGLKNQIFLGSDEFVENTQCKLKLEQSLENVPAQQKGRIKRPLNHYEAKSDLRNE